MAFPVAKKPSKAAEYSIVSNFKYGYRNREDVTNLPPGVLIVGSQNVMTNVSERVQSRQGYTLDGAISFVQAPVASAFDWLTRGNGERHMRVGGLTGVSDANGKMQFRIDAVDETLGNQLVVNPYFTGNANGWTAYNGSTSLGSLPAGNWAYSSNNIAHTPGSTDGVGQQLGIAPQNPYHFQATIGGTVGTVDLWLGDASVGSYAAGTTVDDDVIAANGSGGYSGLMILVPSSDFDGTLDGVRLWQQFDEFDNHIFWKDLLTDLTTVDYNFAKYFNTSENEREVLFVNGTPNIFRWNGAWATLASVDATAGHIAVLNASPTNGGSGYAVGDILTISTGGSGGTATVTSVDGSGAITGVVLTTIGSGYTNGTGKATTGGTGSSATLDITTVADGQIVINGSDTVIDAGFYGTDDLNLNINGNIYTYANVFEKSFLGIDPSAVSEPVNSVILQEVVTTANADMTDIPDTFPNALISTLNNQVFVAALTSSAVYISVVSDYTDYSQSTPRQAGEGGVLILDDNIVGFDPQEDFMYITAGQDLWYNVNFELQTSTVGVTYQQVNAQALKTGRRQAAISQAFISHMKNNIITVTQETTVDTFGRVENIQQTPQITNLSDPVKLDIDQYDFTDGSIFYWRYYIIVAVPKEELVLFYNLANNSWETPQTIPASRFYMVDGELYAHSYLTFESWKLFDGYADRADRGFAGFPINAVFNFSYQNYGSRFSYKKATKMYVEGYINSDTTLRATLTCELDGCKTVKNFELDGSDRQFVCVGGDTGSLGKTSLGKVKLGGDETDSIQGLPPKFRWFPTFTNTDFFENNFTFSVVGFLNQVQILAFGLAVSGSSEIPVQNMD